MLATFIDLGADFATSTLQVAGYILGDLAPYITLVVGILLAVVAVAVLIRVLIHK